MMIHVQYFGDKGRHSWVSANCMMQFTNLADFLTLADSLTIETKKKDRYAAAFVVKQGIKSKWENAVDEAMQVQPMTIEERAEAFAPKIKVSRSRDAKSSTIDEKNKNNKRKNSTDQDEPDAKRVKQDNVILKIVFTHSIHLILFLLNITAFLFLQVHNSEKPEISKLRKSEVSKSKYSRTVNGKMDLKLNSDSLPSSPSSHKSDNTTTRVDKNEEDEDGVFEIYYERNRDLLEDEYPNASENDIKKYLRKTWDGMDTAFRKKYRSYMTRDSSRSKESTPDHEDFETPIEIDTSTRESKKRSKLDKEESSVSETIYKRGRPYNLFKGMKQEKVCQICEKTGKLTRCKGPCYSYFHLSCVKPGESSPEHSVDENTSDDRILDDLNIIKKSINSEHDNNGNNNN